VVAEFATRRVQPWVFVLLAFDGTRFTSVRSLGDQIGGQRVEQFDPQLLALFLGASLGHGGGEVSERVDTAFEKVWGKSE
jgi:hypothetical protein